MSNVKVGTYNLQNLYNRYRLLDNERGSRIKKPINPDDFVQNGGHINMLGWSIDDYGPISKASRKATARVILENSPDVIGLQEVENLFALLQFNKKYLRSLYPYAIVIDGNDPRGIDVGILSKLPIGNIRTHQFEPAGSPLNERTFSRDCLEVEVILEKQTICFFINHFKSQIGGGEEKRRKQAERMVEILKEKYGEKMDGNFVVLGDLNCEPESNELGALFKQSSLVNVINTNLGAHGYETWTHCYRRKKAQYDYIILSNNLAKKNDKSVPYIERRGLSEKIKEYTGDRFNESIGNEGASDHCAVFMEIEL